MIFPLLPAKKTKMCFPLRRLRRTASANRLARAWRERRDGVRRRRREKEEAAERRRRFREGEMRSNGRGSAETEEGDEAKKYDRSRRRGESEFLLRRRSEERRRAREEEWREREGRRAVEWTVHGPYVRASKAAEWGKQAARRVVASVRSER